MRLTLAAAALAAAMSTAVPAHAGGNGLTDPISCRSRSYRGPIIISRRTAISTRNRCLVRHRRTVETQSRSSPATNAIPKIAGTLG